MAVRVYGGMHQETVQPKREKEATLIHNWSRPHATPLLQAAACSRQTRLLKSKLGSPCVRPLARKKQIHHDGFVVAHPRMTPRKMLGRIKNECQQNTLRELSEAIHNPTLIRANMPMGSSQMTECVAKPMRHRPSPRGYKDEREPS